MSRKSWTNKEDQAVLKLVDEYGTKNWAAVSIGMQNVYKFKNRTGKQCRQRYHNHLDPNISRHAWTPLQEKIIFQKHKIYGNKWKSIADHLKGRTDNTIKNHFYSTMRRSLRRMSKQVGSKNSTKEMKYLKPSTLSKIFSINTKPTTEQQIEEDNRKCNQNADYKVLRDFLDESCGQLTDVILQFSSFKPKGKICVLQPQQRERFDSVIAKMKKLNELYEKMKKQQKRLNAINSMNVEQQSSAEYSNSEKEQSKEQQIQLNLKRSKNKRQVHPPKKFQILQLEPLKRENKPQSIVLMKNSELVNEIRQMNRNQQSKKQEEWQDNSPSKYSNRSSSVRQAHIRNNNKLDCQQHQKMNTILMMIQQTDKQDGPYRQEDIGNLFMHQPIGININTNDDFEYFPSQCNQFNLGQTPKSTNSNGSNSQYFDTPALQFNSPTSIYSTPNDLISHISSRWNGKAGELDDIVDSLGMQIAKNSSQSQVVSIQQLREDNRTNSSRSQSRSRSSRSIIANSPNSAFRSYQ